MNAHDEVVDWVKDKYGYYSCTNCRAKRRVEVREVGDPPLWEVVNDTGWKTRSMLDGIWVPTPDCPWEAVHA